MLRSIVIVVIDCLRADHVSCLGYPRPTTPTIDALGRDGVLWTQAHSLSSWTKPSVTSLLTGLYPSEHGAFLGVKRSKGRRDAKTHVLRSTGSTLAESFTKAGWRCGAFINNAQLDPFTRLDRGFATYVPNAGKADRLLSLLEQWLRGDPATPSFAYLHLLEAHWPYKPRRRHVKAFGGDRDTNLFATLSARDYGKLRRSISRGQRTLSDSECEQMMQMYDGAVRRLDGKVKNLWQLLEKLGLENDTALIVTADHGDEFLDHGSIGHGHTLYEELVHVPLVARMPSTPRGLRRNNPVSLVDLPATLLTAAGIEHTLGNADLLSDPTPLSPVCTELCIRNRYTQTIQLDHWKLVRRFRFSLPPGESLPSNQSPKDWVDHHAHEVTHELYDLARDPSEQGDLSAQPEKAAVRTKMVDALNDWWSRHGNLAPADESAEITIDERVVGRLRDLGYID